MSDITLMHGTAKTPALAGIGWGQAVMGLTGPSQSAARLALLTAIAPYQVDDGLIGNFRSIYKEDVQLQNVLAWSSFTAARKIGTWLHVSDQEG